MKHDVSRVTLGLGLAALLGAAAIFTGAGSLAFAKPAKAKPANATAGVVAANLGQAPRKRLKYVLAPATQAAFTMETDTDITMEGAVSNKIVIPTLIMGTSSTVQSVAADGKAKISQVISSASAKDRAGATVTAAMLTDSIKGFKGFTVTMDSDASGGVSNIAFSNAEGVPPQMQGMLTDMAQSMQNMPVLPTVAIGVGATWETVQAITSGGAKVEGRHKFELTAVEGNVISLTDHVTFIGLPQKITAQGQEVDVKSVTGGGTSRIKINLATLEISLDGTSRVVVDMGALKVTTALNIRAYPGLPPMPKAP